MQPFRVDQAILDELPLEDFCEDRDGWIKVGMALHHEYSGSEDGWETWKVYSQQSDKWDEKYARVRWKGFRDKPGGVTMASLKRDANDARLRDSFDDIEDGR